MEDVTINTENTRICVAMWDESNKELWLNLSAPMASLSAVLTRGQAKELAQALMAFVESEVAA